MNRGSPPTSPSGAVLGRLAEIDALLAQARLGGGTRYVERHHARGRLLALERLELLCDPDAPAVLEQG